MSLETAEVYEECCALHLALEKYDGQKVSVRRLPDRMMYRALKNYRESMLALCRMRGLDWRSAVQDYLIARDRKRLSGLKHQQQKPDPVEAAPTAGRRIDAFPGQR